MGPCQKTVSVTDCKSSNFKFQSLFPVSLGRIHTLIKRTTLAHKKKLENSPHLIIPSPVILDMIYGKEKDDLEKFLHTEQEKEAQWYLDQPAQV